MRAIHSHGSIAALVRCHHVFDHSVTCSQSVRPRSDRKLRDPFRQIPAVAMITRGLTSSYMSVKAADSFLRCFYHGMCPSQMLVQYMNVYTCVSQSHDSSFPRSVVVV